jgi:hypothetical protein
MKLSRKILQLALVCALVTLVGLPAAVESQYPEIIAGAKREGKFLLYTSLTLQAPQPSNG